MAPVEQPLEVMASKSQTPYQLDQSQTSQACRLLIKTLGTRGQRSTTQTPKANLLADGDDFADSTDSSYNEVPVWLIVTTKKHVVDKKRLKPGKISLPHSLNKSPASTICLITADPQRTYKNAIADTSFPSGLRKRITRVVGIEKLKGKYKSFESRRQLLAEHDIFLADDRIVTHLPKVLGKVFFKGGTKRPVPVHIASSFKDAELGKRLKRGPEGQREQVAKTGAGSPQDIAREIEKALSSALIHLAPGTSTAVKVGKADFDADMLNANVEVVVNGMAEKYITKGWRNIRAIHLKGPNTMAIPIWLASELWEDEGDVLEEKKAFGKKHKKAIPEGTQAVEAVGSEKSGLSKGKRKAEETSKPTSAKHAKKKRKAEEAAAENADRKDRLRKQKAKAMAEVDEITL